MTNLVVSGLVPTGISVNGESVFLKGDRKVVIRGGAVVVLSDHLVKESEQRFTQKPKRRIRTSWTPVEISLHAGRFDPMKAKAAAERARQEAMADPEKSGYGKKTNIGAGTAKGPGGSKPSKGTSNPRLAEKRARKAAQKKR